MYIKRVIFVKKHFIPMHTKMKNCGFFLFFTFCLTSLMAQKYDLKAPVPIDQAVKIGHLENGLTYYIRKNNRLEKRVDMCLVCRAGAMLEEDQENGMAHFIEHMAFRGTTHFPDDAVTKYCEKNGVKFGDNFNAFTYKEYTTYMLTGIPVIRESLVDSMLLILNDWSGEILFEEDKIEKERNVILEERRTRNGPRFRIDEQLNPVIYHQTRYAYRNVIGDIDALHSFTRNDIVAFYRKWYRPDLQALILVGDFDPEQMEQKVKDLFGKRPAAENPVPVPQYPIPDNNKISIGQAIDPEAGKPDIRIIYQHKGTLPENKNQGYMHDQLIVQLINAMFLDRLIEIIRKENQIMLGLYLPWVNGKDIFSASVTAKDSSTHTAFILLLDEMERVKRFGFTATELERAKVAAQSRTEAAFNDRFSRINASFVTEYTAHFINSNPIPSIGYVTDFTRHTLRELSINEVNKRAKSIFTGNNIVVTQSGTDKTLLLSDDQIRSAFTNVGKSNIEAYQDIVADKKLMTQLPESGTIVSSKIIEKPLAATEWTLSNGARVVLYPTGNKITLSAFSWGGSSLVNDADFPSCQYATIIAGQSGIAGLTKTEYWKMMTGKTVSLSPYISERWEGFNGQSSKEDLETMFQLLYLHFTQPRFERETFNTTLQYGREQVKQKNNNPTSVFADSATWISIGRHPRRRPFSANDLDMVNFETVQKIYKERFADAGDFTFIFTGGFKEEEIKPLVERYIASLPGLGTKEKYEDLGITAPKGKIIADFSVPMKAPKTSIRIRYSGISKYEPDEILNMAAIQQVLSKRYLETIRKEEGATYGVVVEANTWPSPHHNYTLDISFSTDPQQADRMIEIVHKEINRLINEGPDEETIANTKEFWLKNIKDREKDNGRIITLLREYYMWGVDQSMEQKTIENLTRESVRATAQKALTQGNIIQVIMRPDE